MTNAHPCKDGTDGAPCNRYRLGEAYDISRDCRTCWNYAHDVSYNLFHGGDGKITPAPRETVEATPAKTVTLKEMFLGDRIESLLKKIGVTKERIARWFGSCFGCPARQKALNDLDKWARDSDSVPIKTALEMLNKLIGE